MALILDGTNGLSDVDGTAGTPAIRGSDANTGVFFGTDIVGVSTGGTERMRVDASGNVGIGTGSPGRQLTLNATLPILQFTNPTSGTTANDGLLIYQNGLNSVFSNQEAGASIFETNNTERMRIDSSGNLLVGTTSALGTGKVGILHSTLDNNGLVIRTSSTTYNTGSVLFQNSSGGNAGFIQITGANSVSYVTSSDYRLKHDIQPMTGALAKVAALKPVTYKWNADDSESHGFIAHELQAVVPECVVGEKDAVDADGNPQYQGIDTSFLTATLAAALQELHQIVKDQAAEIAELKAKLP